MRVAFDAGPLQERPTGVGRYVHELAAALSARNIELVPFVVSWRLQRRENGVHLRLPARAVQFSWRKWNWPAIDGFVGDVDVVHGTNFVLPAFRKPGGAVTVHDLSFCREEVSTRSDRLAAIVPWSIRRATAVIVPSNAVAEEVAERYVVPGGRLFVTPEGVAPSFFDTVPLGEQELGELGISRPFAMALGTIQPRKNLQRLLDAWQSARTSLAGWTLAIVGPTGWGPELTQVPGVVRLGWLRDELLPGLLSAADLFCFPSLYEGFGLPPLEAMAAGTPALVGRYPAASEVVGDAAMLVDPLDTDAIADGLSRLATDHNLRKQLADAGRARAGRFTWEDTAVATIEAYRAARG